MPQSYTCLHYHFVFSTKHRRPVITEDLRTRLYDYIGGIVRAESGVLLAAGGMPDHIHLLVRLTQNRSVAEVLRLVKTNSSKWARAEFSATSEFAWQDGYGAFAVSYSLIPKVKAYIDRQETHHRKQTFRDELQELLQKSGIVFDEKYLLD